MTQTETPPQEPDEVTGHAHHAPPADDHHDPLHDIDGPKTTYAVVGTLALVVLLIWAMSHLYNVVVQVERQEKIGDIVPVDYKALRAVEDAELAGKIPSRGKKTIDEAIDEYLRK